MIESYVLLAILLAALLQFVKRIRLKIISALAVLIFLFFVGLNIFQSYQYSKTIIPWDMNTKEYYWKSFLKLKRPEEDWKRLNLH
ncbi:MAG: hypothetical protein JST88_10965 [Bacteroidetes bacterium]|nr:hypothetical protein [Bacteroidota bacterium]